MVRSRISAGLLTVCATLAVAGFLAPAVAQFGSIFSDEPPRPPGNVPRGQQLPPADLGRGGDFRSGVDVRRPSQDANQPPSQPQAPPMALPPSSRPGGGTIQSQPLAPPPGGIAAPPLQPNVPVQPAPPPGEQPQGTARSTPGVVPGRGPRGAPEPADTSPQPGDEVVVAPPPQRIANPSAVFSGLDKITGRIISFDVAVNETVQFGALQVTPRVCYSRPPTETPNTDAYIEVEEVTLSGENKRIFDGWMFAASPGLHAVEHPIYDVWITDCKGGAGPEVAEAPPEPAKPAARAPARQPAGQQQRPPQPRAQQQPGFQPAIR